MNLNRLFRMLGNGDDDENAVKKKRLLQIPGTYPPEQQDDMIPSAPSASPVPPPDINGNINGNDDYEMSKLSAIGEAAAKGQRYQPTYSNQDDALFKSLGNRPVLAEQGGGYPMSGRTELSPDKSYGIQGVPLSEIDDQQPTAPPPSDAGYEERQRVASLPPSGKTMEQINDVEKNYKDPHKHSWLGRLFKGIAKGYQQWNGEGGLINFVANTLGKGIGAAASPKQYEELEKKSKVNSLFKQLGRERDQEQYETKQDLAQMKQLDLSNQMRTRSANIENQILNRNADTQNKQAVLQQNALKTTLGLKYYDPKRPDHRAVAAKAGLDPDSIPAFDDRNLVDRQLDDGTTVRVSGADALKAEIESKQFNATKTQDITKFNEENRLKVQEKNIANEMKYQDDVRAIQTQIAQSNAAILEGNTEARDASNRMQTASGLVQAAASEGDTEAFETAKKAFDKASEDFGKALGKSQGGAAIASQFKSMMPKRPKTITYVPAKAATVSGSSELAEQYTQMARNYQSKLDEIKATRDPSRKQSLQREADALRRDALELRQQMNSSKQK